MKKAIKLAAAVFTAVFAMTSSAGNANTGLVAYWPLDGNANDASGNGHNGTVEGATLTTDRNGKANAAYHFEGSRRDTIRVPSSPSLKNITSAATVAAWIKPEKWDNTWVIVFAKGQNARQYGLFADDKGTLYMHDAYRNDAPNVSAKLPKGLKLGVWQHVAVVYDGSKTVTYVNGKPGEPKSTSGKFVPNDEDLFFGRDDYVGSENYTGDIDDMRIYNRALSAAEIAALAGTSVSNSGGGSKTSTTTATSRSGKLLCHLTFDDHSNPLKAKVGQDAIVRTGKDTPASGLGDARWESYIKDGALRIPTGTHLAVPVPAALADRPGHPYTVEMKVRFPEPRDKWCCLMNMPAGNYMDAMAFLTTDADKRVVLKASGRIEGTGTFRLGEWNDFCFQFGEKTTRVFVDGKELFRQDYSLAGSRADCSKAGGYILFAADDNGEENPMALADVKIYDGVVAPSSTSTGGNTTQSGGGNNGGAKNGGGSGGATGNCLCHISFDDSANPLKAQGVANAIVRKNQAERVSGMGEVKWEANGGDGAVAIPIGWHIAVPIPDALTKEPGHPFSVSMKVKFSKFSRDTYPSLLNMPADNGSPGMLYLVIDSNHPDPVITVKQWNKGWGAGINGKGGFTAEKWENITAVFDRNKTEVFLNGAKIISCDGKLEGSYADCSKAGGYILLSADPSPSGGTIHWADLKIYDGAVGVTGGASQSSSGGTKSGNTMTQSGNGGNNNSNGGTTGKCLCRLTFNDRANPLRAEGVANAVVRKNQTERVSGMGEVKWLNESGDGAVEIPKDWHIALPVPAKLARAPGLLWTMRMKFKLSSLGDDWQPLLNMPADNASDSLVYVNKGDSRIAIKQHDKNPGTAVYGESGFAAGKIHTLQLNFDTNKTRAFLDGKQIFSNTGKLAGSYADCAKAGGYFLIRGDEDGEGGTVTFYDVAVYEGSMEPQYFGEGESGGNTTTQSGGGNTTQNDGGGCFYPGSGRDGELKQAPAVKMPDEKRAPDYLNPDGTPVGSPSTKTNTPTTKTNTPTTKTNDPNGKPSAKVQDMLNSLYDDDGSKSDEDKIAELKYYVESHMDEPGIGRIVDRIEDMARQIDDEDTLRWVEDIRKRLAGEVTDDNDRDGNGNGDGDDGSKETDHLGRKDGEGDEGGNNNDEEKKKDNADEDIIEDEGATKDEIVAAAEAAMKDLSVFVPSDEKIEAIDAAFKKMPKIRRAKTESSRRPIEPLMSDAFFDSLPPRQLIAHFRELMRDILGPMTPDTQKRFEKEFAAAISYPTDEVVEWVRKAAPIISEMQRLKAGMMQEFVDFDSTFGEACIAQNFDYYDGAYNRISDASRTVCAMEAIKARMEELFKMYLALGPMPNAAEQQKQDAAEYKAATKAVKDYIIMGDEVSDDIKDIEGVYHADQCSYRLTVSQDSKEPENEGYLTESPTDDHTHAPWRMEKLYIKPITQFGGEDGLVFVYIYGEDPPDGSGETEYDTRVLEAWAVPDGEGGLLFFGGGDNLIAINKETREEYLKDKDIRKKYLHPECIHLKPTKDSDGRPILLFKHHWLHDEGTWKRVSPGSSELHEEYRDKTYTYSTIVFRKSSVEDYQELPEAELETCAATLTTGKTAEEKAREAGRLYPEALKRFEEEREQYTKEAAALGDTYDTLPTIYDLYFVISGAPEIKLGFDYDKTNPMEGNAPVAVYSDKYPGTDDVYLNMAKDRSEVQPPQDYKDRWFVWALMACEEYLGRLDLFGFSHTKKWDISICGGKDCGLDTTPEKKVKVDSASVDFKANWTCPFPTVVRVIEGTGPVAFDIAVETKNSQHDRKIPNPVTGYMVYYGWNDRTVYSTNCLEISSASGGSGRLEAKLDIDYPGDDGFFENLHVDGTNQLHFTVYRGIEGKDYETSALYRSDAVYSATCDYKLMYLDEEQAEALAAKLGESLGEILTPPEEDSDIRDELMQKVEDAKKAQEEQDATIAFHKANIEFIDKRVASLKEEISKEKDPARKDALQFQVICAESDKLYEQDRIRAEQTGVWQPSRTPFDEMCIMQVRESAMREIAEINAANKARKRAEAIADKLPTKAQQDKAYEMINNIITNDPNDYEKLSKLGDIMRDQYMNYLEYDRQMAAAEDAYWSKKLQYAENTKLACDITLSLCGGAGGYAKAIEATYVCVTSYKEGGFTNAFKKTVCTVWDCVDVASEVIDGIVEDGWKGALKKGEISFAMHYGIPYLLGKMKGPPDGTGCYNSFDVDRLNKWNPAPRLATRKPPRVADVNTAFFENNYATQKISNYIEKKNLYEAVKDYTKHSSETVLKAKHEFYKAVGEVNVNPLAKAKLKYDPSYNKLGISKNFAADVDDINEIATTRTMNMMVDQGYSRQELVSFRNDSSIGSVGMDADFGLKEYKDMKITLNGKPVTKHQWAEATQKQLNKDYFEITGQSAERSFVNVTYSGDAESYKNLAILKASKDPEAMRHIMQTSSLSDVQQIMDVTKYKANTMLDIKGHPKLIGQYEAIRGTGKDLETKLIPAIKGEIDAIKKESMALVKVGKALPKAQEIKLEKLQAAHTRYKKVEAACKRVGELKVPLYEANEYIRTATGGKEIPELLDDIEMLMMSMNLMKPKTNLMKIK